MKYEGKLYGKIDGECFDTGHTTEQWDDMINALIEVYKYHDMLRRTGDLDLTHSEKTMLKLSEEALTKAGVDVESEAGKEWL